MKITKISKKNKDGTFIEEIPFGVKAENVTMSTGKTLEEKVEEDRVTMNTITTTLETIQENMEQATLSLVWKPF